MADEKSLTIPGQGMGPMGERGVIMATLRDASVDVPAGHFETTEYVVRDGDVVSTFHFDKRRAGPPISLVVEKGGQVTRRMTLLSRN